MLQGEHQLSLQRTAVFETAQVSVTMKLLFTLRKILAFCAAATL